MLPSLVGSYLLAYLLGTLLMGLLDVADGTLLSSAGVLGWLAAIPVVVITVTPAAAGVELARRALRAGAGASARAALVVNGALLLWLLVTQMAQLLIG